MPQSFKAAESRFVHGGSAWADGDPRATASWVRRRPTPVGLGRRPAWHVARAAPADSGV